MYIINTGIYSKGTKRCDTYIGEPSIKSSLLSYCSRWNLRNRRHIPIITWLTSISVHQTHSRIDIHHVFVFQIPTTAFIDFTSICILKAIGTYITIVVIADAKLQLHNNGWVWSASFCMENQLKCWKIFQFVLLLVTE